MTTPRENFRLTPEQEQELKALAELPDEEIDFSDIPLTTDWSNARRGVFYEAMLHQGVRPPKPPGTRLTDTTEGALEARIVRLLTNGSGDASNAVEISERPAAYPAGWIAGEPADYDRANCVDLKQLSAFLVATQPNVATALALASDNPTRRQFLARLKREIRNRGVIDVLRKGVNHQQHHVNVFYGAPTPGNIDAEARNAQNRFSVTRQLRYSNDERQRALDLALFINGLPIATFELKNGLTKQTVDDAVQQYRNTRSPREDLFHVGRCAVHFALDENEVRFCTKLAGKASVFLPFNRGNDDGGAGNPVNPNGLKTDYLWREALTPRSLTDIIENYAQKVDDEQIWHRYHQLEVVRKLLQDAATEGAGKRYLIQHSAGSGKSHSIAWLSLDDADAEIGPVPAGGGSSGRPEPELEPLSRIIATFNYTYGADFTDADKAAELIRTLPEQVVADNAYRNARRNSDAQNARIEHDAALRRLITSMVRTNTELFRVYTEKPDFRSWLNGEIFRFTYLDDNASALVEL